MADKCPECGDEFSDEHSMRIHYGLSHEGSLAGVSTQCEFCSEEFTTSKNNYKRREMDFCSRDSYGQWISENKTKENHPNYNGGYDYPYNGSWNRMRKLTIKRDFEKCRLCNTSREECKNKYSRDLHVHHKIPVSYFDDAENAHQLYNLITLCPECHNYVEYE